MKSLAIIAGNLAIVREKDVFFFIFFGCNTKEGYRTSRFKFEFNIFVGKFSCFLILNFTREDFIGASQFNTELIKGIVECSN